jgi:hypothetical protein
MKVQPFSTLHALHDIAPEYAQANIEAMFEETDVDTVSAVLTRKPDGGLIGSTHLTKYRIH